MEDSEIRQIMDEKIEALKCERDEKKAELESVQPVENESPFSVDAQGLLEWYDQFLRDTVRVPLDSEAFIERANEGFGNTARYVVAFDQVSGNAFGVDCDKRAINETLHSLGTEIRLRWQSRLIKVRKKFVLERGRFRLGQRIGELTPSVVSK